MLVVVSVVTGEVVRDLLEVTCDTELDSKHLPELRSAALVRPPSTHTPKIGSHPQCPLQSRPQRKVPQSTKVVWDEVKVVVVLIVVVTVEVPVVLADVSIVEVKDELKVDVSVKVLVVLAVELLEEVPVELTDELALSLLVELAVDVKLPLAEVL